MTGKVNRPGGRLRERQLEFDRRAGKVLAAARRGRRLSQREVAELMTTSGLPWSQTTMSYIENGQRALTLLESHILGHILGLSPAAIVSAGAR